MRALLKEVRARGEPSASDQSIAGLLLKLRDPKTGGSACGRMLCIVSMLWWFGQA